MDEPSAQDANQLLPVQEGEAEQGFEDGHLAEQIQVPDFRTPTKTSATEKKRQADVDEEIHLAPLESSKTPHQVRPRGYISDEESPVLYTPQGKHQIVAADVHRDPSLDSGKEVQTPLATGDGERRTATMPEEGQEAETLDGIFLLQPPELTEQSTFIPSFISPIKDASRVQVPCFAETEDHICKLMSKLKKCSFEDLIPENPIRLEAARVFFVLLDMHSKGKVKMNQLMPSGKITVTLL
ncbi:hypothetical protein Pcinc_012567 [Petrolisthes cinctipes]|uniref:Rad21/Rec8-like protein C-terminal eukaryotic domain-containing protein n=1 Tax=Petrolisthes cinctipes TaxID=88211 RepID=A0AAE1FYS1_PETCI|nr:hypothetical protein Pcinc_012567 [Petrolisthes cinctipes]